MRKYFPLPPLNSEYINLSPYFLLFETGLCDEYNFTSYIFTDPVDIISVRSYEDVEGAFGKIESYSKNYYLAGYFSYELGYFFEKASFKLPADLNSPLIHLCVFDKTILFNHKTGKFSLSSPPFLTKESREKEFLISNLAFNFKEAEYKDKIRRIKEYIRRGDTYQVNFTGRYNFNFSGSSLSFYLNLKSRQNVSYSAFCKLKDEYIISLSPELFFKREKSRIYSKPMKGTIGRGKTLIEDRGMALRLKNSFKDKAENLMIVDLVRNDLGRICRINSVKADKLFDIEQYETLFQMTSRVSGILRKDVTYFDIFKNIFPGGSVTGAPKIRTMQIIKELEGCMRNVYCGALGIIMPENRAVFNLPIRTIYLSKNKAQMGTGSGIVIDSDPLVEFKECLLKAGFLTERYKEFQLIETMLYRGGYKFFKPHLKRLKDSAAYFGFQFDSKRISCVLKNLSKGLDRSLSYKVRLLLSKSGKLETGYSLLKGKPPKERLAAISKYKTDPENLFLYHKTTNRVLYDREYNYYSKRGYFDVIFLNKKGEVTEGAISNVIILKGKHYYSPALSSGLLAGIYREHLFRQRRVKEKILYLEDLIKADKVFLCNSVRGLIKVKIRTGRRNVHSRCTVSN